MDHKTNQFTSLVADNTVRIRRYRELPVQFGRHSILLTRGNFADFAEAIATMADHLDDTTESDGVLPETPLSEIR